MTIDEFKKYMKTTFQRPYLSTIYDEANDSIPEMIYYLLEHIAKLEENNIKIEGNFSIFPSGGDDTTLLQEMLDNGYDLISPPEQTYILSQPLKLKFDGQKIDFNHSTIEFTQDQNKPHTTGTVRTNHIGVFNVRGEKTTMTATVTQGDIKNGLLTVDNIGSFAVGQTIELKASCYDTVYNENWLSPKLNVLCTILDIDNHQNTIKVDYQCHSYDIPAADLKGSITLINPIKDCIVKNVVINDKTPIRDGHATSGSNVYSVENSHYACGGIGLEYAINAQVENIIHWNPMFTTVHNTLCKNTTIKNIQTYHPRLIGGGEGYAVQNINGYNIVNENIKGVSTRHTVDISGGGFYQIKNVESLRSIVSDLQFHGAYEHNIIINHFHGIGIDDEHPYFNAGSGTNFGNVSADVVIKNSELKPIASMAVACIKGLVYDHCKLKLHRVTGDVSIINSDIILHELINKVPIKRGQKTSLRIINSTVSMSADNTLGMFDKLQITNSEIKSPVKTATEINLEIKHCGDITISNNKIDVCLLLVSDNASLGTRFTAYAINGNVIGCYRYGGVYFKDNSASVVQAVICGNNFYQSSNYTGSTKPYWLDFGGNSASNSTINVIASGNLAKGLQSHTITTREGSSLNKENNIE